MKPRGKLLIIVLLYSIFLNSMISFDSTKNPAKNEPHLDSKKQLISFINSDQQKTSNIPARVLGGSQVSSSLGSLDTKYFANYFDGSIIHSFLIKQLDNGLSIKNFEKNYDPNSFYNRYRQMKTKAKEEVPRKLLDFYFHTFSKDMFNRCLGIMNEKIQEITVNR